MEAEKASLSTQPALEVCLEAKGTHETQYQSTCIAEGSGVTFRRDLAHCLLRQSLVEGLPWLRKTGFLFAVTWWGQDWHFKIDHVSRQLISHFVYMYVHMCAQSTFAPAGLVNYSRAFLNATFARYPLLS